VATGILHDPYTNATIAFVRGNQTGASVQIDHIVPLALAWDLGARNWNEETRQYSVQFADVVRDYALPVDQASATVLRQAAAGCPTG
jgi:hypothetical protein